MGQSTIENKNKKIREKGGRRLGDLKYQIEPFSFGLAPMLRMATSISEKRSYAEFSSFSAENAFLLLTCEIL